MERIYKRNRSTLVEYKTDGETVNINYLGTKLFELKKFNSIDGKQQFSTIRGKFSKIPSKMSKEDFINNFEKHNVTRDAKSIHFRTREMKINENEFNIVEDVMCPKQDSFIGWRFYTSEKVVVLKRTANSFRLLIGKVQVEIKSTLNINLLVRKDYILLRRFFKASTIAKVDIIFKVHVGSLSKENSVKPNQYLSAGHTMPYLLSSNVNRVLDIVLVPLPFSKMDYVLENSNEEHMYHKPYSDVFERRQTDKLYIFDNIDNKPCMFIGNEKQTSTLIKELVSKQGEYEVVNVIGIDLSSIFAQKLAKEDFIQNIMLINPVISLIEIYEEEFKRIEKEFPVDKYHKLSKKLLKNALESEAKIIVSPYSRGYWGFMKTLEKTSYKDVKKLDLKIIRSNKELEDYMLLAEEVHKLEQL